MTRPPIAIDLFAGAGGMSEGLEAAGIEVTLAVEHHPHAARTYAFNHPHAAVICGDIRQIKFDRLAEIVHDRTACTHIDLVVGGPPCQGFSPAGKRRRTDPRNELYRYFVEVLAALDPRAFIFENVPGFAKLYGGAMLKDLRSRLSSLGYSVVGVPTDPTIGSVPLPIIDAAWYGVPQHRRRLLLIGWRNDSLNNFGWPLPTHGHGDLEDTVFEDATITRRKPYVTIKQAIGDLAFLSAGFESHEYELRAMSEYQRARRNGNATLFNHLATQHRAATVQLFRNLTPGGTLRGIPERLRTGKQTMRRLDERGVARAVLALPDDMVHYQRHRIPTVREMARLQSFDDDFVFLGKRTTSDLGRRVDVPQYTQVGNAVPPLLARAVGAAVVRALGGIVTDLRDTAARRLRHGWLRGSSGFQGYVLDPDAAARICLLDTEGKPLAERPSASILVDSASPSLSLAEANNSPRKWKRNRRRRFAG